jgi:hypothetical protein
MLLSACAASQPQDIQYPRDAIAEGPPQLSGSVDSAADEDAVDMSTETTPVDIIQPRIQKQDSTDSSRSRGRERHITSGELKKIVVSIVEAKVPLNAPLPSIPRSPFVEMTTPAPEPERTRSMTLESPYQTSGILEPTDAPAPKTRSAAIQGSHRLQRPIPTEDDYDESAIDDDDEDWEEESAEESSNSMAEKDINF